MLQNKKIIAIVGPTASGKSDLAIQLARKYNGEVISADSRQVYRGMDVGTGKVTRKEQKRIHHHLLDVANPRRSYNVTHFIRDAKKALASIQKHGKLPIICGGTGFWAQGLLEGQTFPEVKPDLALRKKLEKKTVDELFKMLKKEDPRRAGSVDRNNKIRLIRALEIVETLGQVPLTKPSTLNPVPSLVIVLNPAKETLLRNIEKRLRKRLKQGMIREVKKLRKEGVSWKRLESFGLEYKNVALFLQKKISQEQMKKNILRESWHYAKRQLSWLRRWEKQGAQIHWISDQKEAVILLGSWTSK